MGTLGKNKHSNLIIIGMAVAVCLSSLPVLAADVDDTPIRLDMTIEIAGADESGVATKKELKDAGLPMVPAQPTAKSRDPLAPANQATDTTEQPAQAAPAAQTMPTSEPKTEMAAKPAPTGYYVRLDTGFAFAQDMDARSRNGNHITSTMGNAPLLSAGIGYYLDSAVRIEGAVSYRSDMDIGGTDGAGNTVDGEADSFDAMLNIYYDIREAHDWLGNDMVTPYVGAGVGLASIRTSDLATSGGVTEGGDRSYNVGYALMAGIAANLSESMLFDVGYRFANLGSFDQDGRFSNGTTAAATSYDDLLSHEIRAGLRFAF